MYRKSKKTTSVDSFGLYKSLKIVILFSAKSKMKVSFLRNLVVAPPPHYTSTIITFHKMYRRSKKTIKSDHFWSPKSKKDSYQALGKVQSLDQNN